MVYSLFVAVVVYYGDCLISVFICCSMQPWFDLFMVLTSNFIM